MAKINIEIKSEDIIDAMNSNPRFMRQFWSQIAGRLDNGSLSETTCDALSELESGHAIFIGQMLEKLAADIKFRFDS